MLAAAHGVVCAAAGPTFVHCGTREGVLGFIGNGSKPDELVELRQKVGQQKMIWTPGVNREVGDGEMGQRYGDPYDAVIAGSDCIIVGSGIHGAEHPKTAAQSYAQISWNALLSR